MSRDKTTPIVEGQHFTNVAANFAGAPPFRDDTAVAISDERPDGGVHVAGFLASSGVTWNGLIFRHGDPTIIGIFEDHDLPPDTEEREVIPDDRRPETPNDQREGQGETEAAQEAEQESKNEAEQEAEPEAENEAEAEGAGGDDELLQLIHKVAGELDQEVLGELGVALGDHCDATINRRMKELEAANVLALQAIADEGLAIRTIIKADEVRTVELPDGQLAHKDLAVVLALVKSGAQNVMLVGPAGCGKTTLARQVALTLGHERFAALSCSPGMSEAKVLGRLGIPTEKNESGYHETAIMNVFRNGGTILFDEMDNADASMMVSFNAMTDGGFATLPTGETVPRHPDTVLIAACNTFGHGADRMYVGRNQLDAATLDRFVGSTVEMDYDKTLERRLVPETEIRNPVWQMRDKARKHGLRRVVSTRALQAARRRHLGLGESMPEVLQKLTLGWSPQDRAAVGVM